MSKILFARVSGTVRWSGGTAVLAAGRSTAHPDHPLVKERPDLWGAAEVRLDFPAPPAPVEDPPAVEAPPAPVERATQAPGERRTTRRG